MTNRNDVDPFGAIPLWLLILMIAFCSFIAYRDFIAPALAQ